MKEILYNDDKLSALEIDEVVIRVKALLINSKQEIMLGYANKTYQFLGGHLEVDETLEECLIREVQEESGIILDQECLQPLLKTVYYTRNYRNTGKNRENDIYFYVVKTDATEQLDKTNYTKMEEKGNFGIRRIHLDKIEEILKKSIPDNPLNEVIVEEMLEAIKEYKKVGM